MKPSLRRMQGFTLIELLVVVAIIGILAVIGIQSFSGQMRSAARSEAKSNLQNIRLLEEQRFADSGSYVGGDDVAEIKTALPGFQPGSGLNYSYSITVTVVSSRPCFTATATGNTGTRVEDDVLSIDCSNNRTGF